jgi:hypothetical protein
MKHFQNVLASSSLPSSSCGDEWFVSESLRRSKIQWTIGYGEWQVECSDRYGAKATIFFHRKRTDAADPSGGVVEYLELSCHSASFGLLEHFVESARLESLNERRDKIQLFRPSYDGKTWIPLRSLEPRSLNSLFLKDEVQAMIRKKISAFLHPDTKKLYARQSRLYKLGMLFEGPPGGGKTSTVRILTVNSIGFELIRLFVTLDFPLYC